MKDSDTIHNTQADRDLVLRYRAGDHTALDELVARHVNSVYAFVRRYVGVEEAEDVTQDTFVKVWKNFDKFDETKNFKVWIFTIAKNTALDWLKKRKALPFSSIESFDESLAFEDTIVDEKPLPDELAHKNLTKEAVTAGLEKLNLDYRVVITLRAEHGLTFREIAEVTGRPLDTVKSHYRRAVAALKHHLDGLDIGGNAPEKAV